MKRLILPAILSLSTLALVYKAPANAAINTNKEIDAITELTTVETENTPQLEVEIDSDTEEVAYYYCHWHHSYYGPYQHCHL